jgi:hypothetical protein
MGRWTEALAGAGLGLVVGLLMGLSTASVVGGVVAALAAALAAFLGLSPNITSDRTVRVGAFGLACSIGVIAGLSIRTGSAGLSPTVRADVEAWSQAGFPPEEAREMVAYQRLGVHPKSREVSPKPAPSAESPVLFSTTADFCSLTTGLPPTEVLKAIKGPTFGRVGSAFAAAVEAAPVPSQAEVVNAFRRSLCGA